MATGKILLIGGGGSSSGGGGGGAGEFLYDASYSLSAGSYAVVVAAQTAAGRTAGSDSTFDGNTAIGGGASGGANVGGNGGSGGGGYEGGGNAGGTASGSHTGNAGGAGSADNATGGGGGGAGSAGQAGQGGTVGGDGGNGLANSISGSSVTYAGGGGGYQDGTGGTGGGGNGRNHGGSVDGTANTGGGGGDTGKGASGIVIIRYTTTDFNGGLGGTITTSGTETIHTFTSDGTLILYPLIKKIAGVAIASVKTICDVWNPYENDAEQYTGGNTDEYYGYTNPDKIALGQGVIFETGGKLTKVSLEMKKTGSPTATTTVYLYSDNGSGLPSSALSTIDTIAESSLTTSYVWYDFEIALASAYPVVRGTQYHIVMKTTNQSAADYVRVHAKDGGDYANGHGTFSTLAGVWANLGGDTDWDLNFKSYVQGAVSVKKVSGVQNKATEI